MGASARVDKQHYASFLTGPKFCHFQCQTTHHILKSYHFLDMKP